MKSKKKKGRKSMEIELLKEKLRRSATNMSIFLQENHCLKERLKNINNEMARLVAHHVSQAVAQIEKERDTAIARAERAEAIAKKDKKGKK